MREQGIAANATPRAIRGRNEGKTRDAIYRAQHRGASTVVRRRVTDVAKQLVQNGSFHDPVRIKLVESRKAIVARWLGVAEALDTQGEIIPAGEVRHFAQHLPKVLTDKERRAVQFAERLRAKAKPTTVQPESIHERTR
jgi:type IV secretion system T-DNA border endonuclease VirD2